MGTLQYTYYDFNVYFSKSFVIHIILGKYRPKTWCCPNWLESSICVHYWYYMVIVIEISNFSKFSFRSTLFSSNWRNHIVMLIINLIFSFSISLKNSIFLLVCNYINNIYLFQKLNIFLRSKEVQIRLTQLLYCEANFANSYVTVRKL